MLASLSTSRKAELAVAALTSIAMVLLIVTVQQLSHPPADDAAAAVPDPIAVFPDFASIESVDVKKQQFFDYLHDFVRAEQDRILALRRELRSYLDIASSGVAFSRRERDWILNLAEDYRIDSSVLAYPEIVDELMLRVDVVPASLALAQAANESAWGTSRFALEGNNVFGQWCYEEGCGIVPARRRVGASHEVKSFESVEKSVSAYFLNINSHPSYEYLRELRAEMRDRRQRLDPMVLAFGLGRYSERGEHYVDEVQNIILQNQLLLRDRS